MDCNCFKISLSQFVFFIIFTSSVCSAQTHHSNRATEEGFRPRAESEKLKHVKAYLEKINKRAVKTIKLQSFTSRDIIDCVPRQQQPAFDNPLLKGQKIMQPPSDLISPEKFEDFQLWRMNGESCPANTIPILRITIEDVMRTSSVETFGRKTIRTTSNNINRGHEYAIAYVNGSAYSGARATINVWAPKVEASGEFSVSQIWLIGGEFGSDELNTIEVGWEVNPGFYVDTGRPRLFIYWTKDNYNKTGCYNLLCSGFVQTHDRIAFGAEIAPVSSYNVFDKQFDIRIKVYKHRTPAGDNWWLKVNDIFVGYWPSNLFTHLGEAANMVEFGGEIANNGSNRVEMGSGHFAEEGFGGASFFKNISVFGSERRPISLGPTDLNFETTRNECYTIAQNLTITNFGVNFFYGGPGCK